MIVSEMHPLFNQVLVQKNLSKAGDLFTLEDNYVIKDFATVLATIQGIITQPTFLTSQNDQSLVEICITRLTSAIRDTGSIEENAKSMVAILETCLSYNLRPGPYGLDPPHAKIASDLMSCIFLNYSKKSVMELAVPVSVKFLHKGNKDLSRNMSSYLSLAAIDNAELLAQHIQPIIDSVISGNYSLARVLPTIYAVNRDPINNHAMTLVSILPNCESNEKLALLTLFSLIAKNNANLLESSVPQLCENLNSPSTASATLQVLYNVALVKPLILVDHLKQYMNTAQDLPKTAIASFQVMCAIIKVKEDKAPEVLEFILENIGSLESEKHYLALKEIIGLIHAFPYLLTQNVINKVSNLEDGASSITRTLIQELRNEFKQRATQEASGPVTIVKVGGGSKVDSSPVKPAHIYQQQAAKVENRASGSSGSKVWLDKASSQSKGSNSHRSMTKLNYGNASVLNSAPFVTKSNLPVTSPSIVSQGGIQGFDSRIGLNKSMTRLNSSHQNMTRFSSSSQIVPQVARSVTCIANGVATSRPFSSVSSNVYTGSRVTAIASNSNLQGSPTKSMSSGSMSAVTSLTADGREVLTVNVNQISADLHRQASTVLSQHLTELPPVTPLPTSSFGHLATAPYSSHFTHHATTTQNHYHGNMSTPFSMPSHSSRRVPPYNSGPLPVPSSHPPPFVTGTQNTHQAQLPPPQQNHQHPQQRPPRASVLSNTLPSPRKRSENNKGESANDSIRDRQPLSASLDDPKDDDDVRDVKQNRMSVFEPYPMRDAVQHFCEKHLDKIKAYMTSLSVKLPLPVKCTIEERKGRKHAKLHFACQGRSTDFCLYKSSFYTMKTRNPRTWIHLMFLSLQARSKSAIGTRETSVAALKHCWEILKCDSISFVTLVTGAFPPAKDQDALMHELRSHRFFDVFEYNGPEQHWGCFLCNHPDRAMNFIQDDAPVIEGQLKEKKGGKWKFLKKWKSRYFTLSGAKLTYKESVGESVGFTQTLDIGTIRSVKVTREGRRNIPKAFEIFTHDEKTFILKAKDGSNAQEWVQCLSVAKAHLEARETNLRKFAYAGSLGRLNSHHPHGRGGINARVSLANSNIALRTAV